MTPSGTPRTRQARIRVGFVVHVMQIAGAEVLVAETIRRLGERIEPAVFCLDAIGPLGERLRREGVDVLSFERQPGMDLRVARRMAAEIRTRRLDVLHAHQYTPFFYGALAARWGTRGPRVLFTEHGRHYPDVVSARRRWANRLIFDHLADEVTAVCGFSARHLAEQDGFSLGRITVIPNGVEVSRYGRSSEIATVRRSLGLRPERRYIAAVARFHPVKDHPTLLRAFAECARSRPDVDLLLVGDGATRSDLERLAEGLGLPDRILFWGVRDDVATILGVVDVFALTSLSEAASITLLEAMASELPVVVTAVGGNPEIVRDGVDGLLVPRGDVRAAAAALGRVLDDAGLARVMGASGAERVRSHFRLERTIERYGDLYQHLARAAGGGQTQDREIRR
jgi:glycosyltransferase involved in cell wall biosynthesis